MNENKFISQRTHTRVKYSPLNIHCQLSCMTPQSPCAQSVTTLSGAYQYEPDRTLTPTVIFPDVRATDPDDIFPHGAANENISLDSLQWLVDDKPISSVWNEGEYEIDLSDTDTRGLLRIKKNFPASESVVLKFKGEVLDWRTGVKYNVESDDIALTCTDKGEDIFSCSVDKANGEYDPLYDYLLLFDYKKARGQTTTGSREDYKNGSYEYDINVVLNKGTEPYSTLPDDIEMVVTDLATNNVVGEMECGITKIKYPVISLDLRLVDDANLMVSFKQGENNIASTSFGVHRKSSMPTFGKPLRGADIRPSHQVYENSCVLNSDRGLIEYPECYFLICWHTQATYIENSISKFGEIKDWQYGDKMLANVSELGIGHTYNDSFFDVWFDVEPHAVLNFIEDGGEMLTDEEGYILIG